MTTTTAPPCANHRDQVAVAVIHSDGGVERFVCVTCADRFWQLDHMTGGHTATLTYLSDTDRHGRGDLDYVGDAWRRNRGFDYGEAYRRNRD